MRSTSGDLAVSRRVRAPRHAPAAARLALFAMLVTGCGVVHQLSNVEPLNLSAGLVKGRVTDDRTGRGIREGSVHLLDTAGAPVQGQTAVAWLDTAGQYRFPNVHPGSYRLRVDVPGYEAKRSDPFSIEPTITFEVNFALRSAAER